MNIINLQIIITEKKYTHFFNHKYLDKKKRKNLHRKKNKKREENKRKRRRIKILKDMKFFLL